MTKHEVIRRFRAKKLHELKLQERKHNNGVCNPELRESMWKEYTGTMLKEGYISQKQYETWTNPFISENYR
jgi:hypothetical protein